MLVAHRVPAARISQRYLLTSSLARRRSGARAEPAFVDATHLPQLVRVGPVAVGAGLEERGKPLQAPVREKDAELGLELALADDRVPVAVRPERRGSVVDVERTKPIEPDALVQLVEQLVHDLALRHVDSRHVEVARVETNAEP